jgi:hypothetical protein
MKVALAAVVATNTISGARRQRTSGNVEQAASSVPTTSR